jgi:hypothetical protein
MTCGLAEEETRLVTSRGKANNFTRATARWVS